MSNAIHVFDYLQARGEPEIRPVCVVFGDERFLRLLARRRIQQQVCPGEEGVLAVTLDGEESQWRDVADELSTGSLFGGGGRRLVIVDQADAFVTRNRTALEKYVERPKAAGVLLLDVAAWPANTRLYQAVDQRGLAIECRAPEKLAGKQKVLDETRLCRWLAEWAQCQHGVSLEPSAARLLLELVGPQLGILDQDLAKLALFLEPGGRITADMVRDVIGGWRAKTVWELAEAAAGGEAAEALRQLHRLLGAGEHPIALLGALAWSLRRFAAATRIFEDAERRGAPLPLRQALEQAGFRKWPPQALENAERQLRQLGRQRAGALYQWLLEADLSLKGSHSSDHRARFVLERLIFRMAKEAASGLPAAPR